MAGHQSIDFDKISWPFLIKLTALATLLGVLAGWLVTKDRVFHCPSGTRMEMMAVKKQGLLARCVPK